MSRARTLAGAIGSDGALNVADVAGLAAVASSGSASDLSTGTLPIARIADGAVSTAKLADSAITTAKINAAAITAAKLASGAAVSNIGFTPVNNNDFNISKWTGSNIGNSGVVLTDSWGWGAGDSFNNCYFYIVAWNTNSASGYTGATSTALFLEYGPYRARFQSNAWNTTTDIVEYTFPNDGARGFRFNSVDVTTNTWSIHRINLLY